MIHPQLKNKKGISPVIATVLLIVLVLVIALIIFLWFRGISREAVTKFEGKNVEIVCGDVSFEASISSGTKVYVLNNGNVPIYGIMMRVYKPGGYETYDLREIEGTAWPSTGLNAVKAFSGTYVQLQGAEKVILIPSLLGVSESGSESEEFKVIHVCEETHGKQAYFE